MSSSTRICPSQATLPPMPMVGIGAAAGIRRASGSATASITTENAPASVTARASSSIGPQSASSRPCARNEPMVLIDWGVKPTWPITGTPRSVRKAMVSAMRRPPSSLIAPQWVSLSPRAPGAAHHRVALQDHHVERDRHGGLEPVHDHAERVAYQDHVAIFVDEARGVRVIGGKRHDRLAVLAAADVGRGEALDLFLHGHARVRSV